MTPQHCPIYCDLMQQADLIHDDWNKLLDQALLDRQYERISLDEYYAKMGEVTGLQNRYVELRDQAIEADHLYWLEEETHTEYHARAIYDERP